MFRKILIFISNLWPLENRIYLSWKYKYLYLQQTSKEDQRLGPPKCIENWSLHFVIKSFEKIANIVIITSLLSIIWCYSVFYGCLSKILLFLTLTLSIHFAVDSLGLGRSKVINTLTLRGRGTGLSGKISLLIRK